MDSAKPRQGKPSKPSKAKRGKASQAKPSKPSHFFAVPPWSSVVLRGHPLSPCGPPFSPVDVAVAGFY